MNLTINLHKIITFILTAILVISATVAITPAVTHAFGGDSGDGSSEGCGGCGDGGSDFGGADFGGANGDADPGGGDYNYTPYINPSIRASCTLSVLDSSITNGDSTVLQLRSTGATTATINYSVGAVAVNSDTTVSPTSTRTYTATVYSAAGFPSRCTARVTVAAAPDPAPTCTISANPSTIHSGGNTTLSWSSSYATSATINNGVGTVGTSGSYTLSDLTNDSTYTITVTGPNGSAICRADVSVTQTSQTTPQCSVWISPTTVDNNGQATLRWSSNNATSMYISGIGTVSSNTNGSQIFYNITSDRTFTCTARDNNGNVDTDTTLVRVRAQQYNAPTCTIFASPISVPAGGDSTITWSTTGAHSVSLSGVGSVPINGSRTLYNLGTTSNYTLTVSGYGGSTTCTRTIGVYSPYQPPVVPPTTIRPSCQIYPVYVNGNNSANGGGAILNWTAQNAASATLTNHGSVNRVSGTQFVSPNTSKTYTLTVFNDGYRASCSTHLTVAGQAITHYTPSKHVDLVNVPYTGAEDYVYLLALIGLLLATGTVVFVQRRHILPLS